MLKEDMQKLVQQRKMQRTDEMEMDDSLWAPLKTAAERCRRTSFSIMLFDFCFSFYFQQMLSTSFLQLHVQAISWVAFTEQTIMQQHLKL